MKGTGIQRSIARDEEQRVERKLKQGGLRAPSESLQVGIFPAGRRATLGFLGLALGAAFIFFPLSHLLGFFSIAFGDRRFSWPSDGSLLSCECVLE